MLNDGWPSKPNKGFSTPPSPLPPRSPVTRGALWSDNKLHLRLYHRRRCLIILYRKKRQVRTRSPSNWPSEMVWLSPPPPPSTPNHYHLGFSASSSLLLRIVASHWGWQELHLHYSRVNCSSATRPSLSPLNILSCHPWQKLIVSWRVSVRRQQGRNGKSEWPLLRQSSNTLGNTRSQIRY